MKSLKTEVLIIGSGAGGSTLFRQLSKNGVQVTMIEEGLSTTQSDLLQTESDRLRKFYRHSGIQPIFGNPTFLFGEGKLVGGSTEINGGLLWPIPERVLQDWTQNKGLFNDVSITHLEKIFESFELDLSVTSMKPINSSDKASTLLAAGASFLGLKSTSARRAVSGCVRTNQCAVGCPTGAKNSMSKSFIPEGLRNGGILKSGLKAKKIIIGHGNMISSIICEEIDSGQIVEIFARDYFLAAGAINSPNLLSTVNSKNLLTQIGFHLNTKVIAEFGEPIHSEYGTIFTEQVQDFMDLGLLFMSTNFTPELFSLGLASSNNEKVKNLWNKIENLATYTLQLKPSNYGKIAALNGKSITFFNLNYMDQIQLKWGISKLCQILFAANAQTIYLPFKGMPEAHNSKEVDEILTKIKKSDWQITSVHAMSSLPLRAKSSIGFDSYGKSNFFKNLYICDASALPTTIGESPQGAIMVTSFYIAEKYIQSLKVGGR